MKKEYESPVYHVRRVPVEKVRANSYNPNHVAPPEMKLLELSIWEDGYTMPCVCYYIPDEDVYELVDGYHRYCVLRTSKRVFEREKGLLPVVVIEKDLSNRMASTIRHNRARGTHSVELMVDIVAELTKAGYRNGCRRTITSETDIRTDGTVCRQGVFYPGGSMTTISLNKRTN